MVVRNDFCIGLVWIGVIWKEIGVPSVQRAASFRVTTAVPKIRWQNKELLLEGFLFFFEAMILLRKHTKNTDQLSNHLSQENTSSPFSKETHQQMIARIVNSTA